MREDQKNAAVAEATQMIAHDVRKPFQMLRFALQTLIASKNEAVHKIGMQISSDIDSSVRSVNAMLNDIIDIGKDVKPNLQSVSPADLVNAATKEIMRLNPNSGVTFVHEFSHKQMVRADREQVHRVLSNLLENALQAVHTKGEIRISIEDVKDDFVAFSVRNYGPVIQMERREDIFRPYFTTKKTGTGLGLAIAKKLVTAQGGEISFESNEQTGTTFRFTLEADALLGETYDGVPSDESSLKRLRERNVLVFDDERAVHAIWRHYAEEHGYQTFFHFQNWEDFVAQDAHGLAKDAVAFVDLRFENSKFNGFDIARYLKKLGAGKILAMTSDQGAAEKSGLFEGVFGKELPPDLASLVG
jgi:two-component sensor histidine kinase